MGVGDEIIGSGLARQVRTQNKRAAFGDGKRIIWGPHCEQVFANNPHIARPGCENDPDLVWIRHYKGARAYNRLSDDRRRWIWNYDFKVKTGEFYFDHSERIFWHERPIIIIEPNVEWQKSVAVNKDWGEEKYLTVARTLIARGYEVRQFRHQNARRQVADWIGGAMPFRMAVTALSRALLYIGPEGGMHHAAAAVGIPAVVLFGGFIPAKVMGYDMHANMDAGAEACGRIDACPHCRAAMDSITANQVIEQALRLLPDEV